MDAGPPPIIPWPIIEPLPGCWFIIDPLSGWLFCWLSCCARALTVTAIAASKTTASIEPLIVFMALLQLSF
jgi:hypothetical protein